MHQLLRRASLLGTVAGASALLIGITGSAYADSTGGRPGDIVGVGSDTLQNAVNFVFDGYPGATGAYNSLGGKNRVLSFDATGDAQGRLPYDGTCGPAGATGLGAFCDSTTNLAPNSLATTAILREGTKPVQRPNGSGAGVAALNLDAAGGTKYQGLPLGSIQFARMSRQPNAGEEGNCPTTGSCGGLHVYQLATDHLGIASLTNNSNAVALSAQELIGIYQCTTTQWNQLPGNSGGSSDTIHPLLPQPGSGTRAFFLGALTTANGNTAVNPGPCVRTVEEHDPTGIYADSAPQDAIEPFSVGKISMINAGYFTNGITYASGSTTIAGTAAPNGAYTPNLLHIISGTPGDSNALYNDNRQLFITIRQADLASTQPIQPGSSVNWATFLFAGSASVTPVIAKAGFQNLVADAGFTPAYGDCGVNPDPSSLPVCNNPF